VGLKYGVFHIRHAGILAYMIGAVLIGITTAKLVEIPVLRLRERLFPRHGQAAPARLNDDVPRQVLSTGAI